MTIDKLKAERNGRTYPYVTVTKGMSGYFAVLIWLNPEFDGFEEPYDTGLGRYGEPEPAVCEAKQWAKDIECGYIDPKWDLPS